MKVRYGFLAACLLSACVVFGWLSLGPLPASGQFLLPEPEEDQVRVTLASDSPVYAWPDAEASVLGELPTGTVVPINGRSPDSGWWRIDYPGGPNGKGWLPASLVVDPGDASHNVTVVHVVLVTATPIPTSTARPCQNDSRYVADVTIPDGTQIGANQSFDKTWRMLNTGSCSWSKGTELIFQVGEAMSTSSNVPVPETAPGSAADISVNMTAPDTPGSHKGIWQMRSPLGEWFGDRITVVIEVPGSDAVPVPPAPGPAPEQPSPEPQPATVEFWSDRTRINGDECLTVSWATSNVQAVYLEYGGEVYGVDGNSSREVCPVRDGKRYTLRVIMQDGSAEVREINIHVDNPKDVKIDMWVDTDELKVGECTRVHWDTQNAAKVEFYDGDDWKDVNRSDHRQVCPKSKTTYKIEVVDLYDVEHTRDVTVHVSD